MANRFTDKQAAFIDAYFLCGLNATEAARLAGYKSPRQMASENLSKPYIRAEIDRRLNERTMKADEVLYHLGEQATADIGDFFKVVEEWTFYPPPTADILDAVEVIDDSDPDDPKTRVSYFVRRVAVDTDRLVDPAYSHLLHKFTDSPKGGLTIELYNKQNALVHLGKHYALFTDKHRHEDWRSDAIQMIRDNQLTYKALEDELGTDLATQLFKESGVPVEVGASTGEE